MVKSLVLMFLFLTQYLLFISSAELVEEKQEDHKTKLFVFGDSNVDTGNWGKDNGICWIEPYGLTHPGKPSGRFSDGRVLTDYVASHLHIKSPIPYEQWKLMNGTRKANKQRFGMNFAYGATGVSDMASRIDILDRLINKDKVYTNLDLQSSIALVSIGRYDYDNYERTDTNVSLPEFTKNVVKQLVKNVKRIHSLGIQKIAVASLEPIGCIPVSTFSMGVLGYESCRNSSNEVAINHNKLLRRGLERLTNQSNGLTLIVLDLYHAFLSALQLKQVLPGNTEDYPNPLLRPCCEGTKNDDYQCGDVEGGVAKYTICDNLKSAFFWDMEHPTQNGWHHVYISIQPSLRSLIKS